MGKNVYQEHGYKDRREYLETLADEYGMDKSTVFSIASILGKDEDFDGLVTTLEDGEWE